MYYNDILLIRKHIMFENYLKNFVTKGTPVKEVLSLFFKKTSDLNDVEYLMDAYIMPIDEINKLLNWYDNQSFFDKPDEMEIIKNLAERYGVDRNKIIKRIQNIRGINKVKKSVLKVKKIKGR